MTQERAYHTNKMPYWDLNPGPSAHNPLSQTRRQIIVARRL